MINRAHLSIRETNVMKGISMLLIMFHNFFHHIEPKTGENEFRFNPEYFRRLLHFLQTEPFEAIRHLSSYFGHYGVQFFIFISSYGLYMSYKNRSPEWWNFMKKRLRKLYPTLVLGILFVMVLYLLTSARFPSVYMVKESLLKLTLLYGFIPGSALSVSGPWWFFSAIVQLYAFFPLLNFLTKKYGSNAMLVVAAVFIGLSMLFNTFLHIEGFSIYFTFIGQLPVFALGIYFASRPAIKIPASVVIAALIIFAAANVYKPAWYFSFISVAILLLAVMLPLLGLIQRYRYLNSTLIFTGSISLFLFAIHGSLRYPFVQLAERYNYPVLTVGIAFLFIILSYVVALMLRSLEKLLQELIESGYKPRVMWNRIKKNEY